MAIRRSTMEPGERDTYVRIEQRPSADAITTTLVDAAAVETSGFPVDGPWTTLRSVWMARFDVGGRERFQAEQLSASYDTRWELPYAADMDPDLLDVTKLRRLVYRSRTHDIVTASIIGRREGVELTTLAKVG